MIKIITIDREYGSGGSEIAEKVANQRGWTLWDQNLTCEIARLAKCERSAVEKREERNDSLQYRLLKSFIRGGFEGSLNAQHLLDALDSDTLVHFTQQVVENAAKAGNCVIVGRGSAYFLHGIRDAFHVFVYSTKEDKLARLRKAGKSRSEALELIETVDRDRAAYIKHHHGKCWPDRYLFNLMVNASAGVDTVVQIITQAVSTFEANHLDEVVLTEPGTQCA